ncbi:MAG TPA: hypothetical protein VIV60_09810 [Polyangiaceae bacterium]
MFELPDPGLYRTTTAMPGHEEQFPANALVFVGQAANGGGIFVVRPGANRKNRWFWGEPTTPLRSPTWSKTLKPLPSEGFYVLPDAIELDGGGRWLKGAIVQLGYNAEGHGILFVAEWNEDATENVLAFSDKGILVDDKMLDRLIWAPILPTRNQQA